MKLLNKSILTIIFSLFVVVAFSQQSNFERKNLNPEFSTDLRTPRLQHTVGSSQTVIGEEAPVQVQGEGDGNEGGNLVPVDDYQYYLVGLGVLLTGIVVYRRNQLQKA
ncbi:hypothetical protein NMK71_00415 [Weeksellaceae bacterium KMM 9713]|uniref:Uncharacterized protein n=1 Tax=Profundicola chukchiensis TaxID=2961959 RepID=A0A9X4RTQ9_9FLAO|nr:hypothetical protein [Profundicola chukchiensis]MDG4944866.1 hypothetical protein [Profundicola chukchiensis]